MTTPAGGASEPGRQVPKADLALIGRKAEPVSFEYGPREVALYALSVGAESGDLALVWEKAPGGLRVLPSFCFVAMTALGDQFTDLVEDYHRVAAGERLVLHRPLQVPGRLLVSAEIADIFDKGSFALMVTHVQGHDEEGRLVFDLNSSSAMLGSGEYGGASGPRSPGRRPPDRAPELRTSCPIPENQAALYQLNGVDDPVHIDPAFARSRGFDRPILHGPCTLGYATRILVQDLCNGEPSRLSEIETRYAATVYPGDTLTVEAWAESEKSYLFQASTDSGPVLSHGHVVFA